MTTTTQFFRRQNLLVTVRRVSAADAPAMQRFVEGLSARSRRWRFHGWVNGCGEAFLRHLTEVDFDDHVAFVAYVGDDLVGEARYVRGGHLTEAEFAIAVADGYQGRGIARALMDALLAAAREAGVAHLYGDVMEDNAAMAAFMQRQGFAIDLARWDTVDAGLVRYQRAVRASLHEHLLGRLPAWLSTVGLPSFDGLAQRFARVARSAA